MPNLAEALKQAMVRIARKEIRDQTGITKRAANQHRRDDGVVETAFGEDREREEAGQRDSWRRSEHGS